MLASGLMAAMIAAGPPACPAERAIYTLRGESGVTAGFVKQRYQINYASKLFFWIRTPGEQGAPARRWWFSFNAPNGYGGVYLTPDVDATKITEADHEAEPPVSLVPVPDPIEVDFDTFDAAYNHLPGPPQIGERAPDHLFARGLGPLFWYNPTAAANGDKTAKATSIPIAMWDRTGCVPK